MATINHEFKPAGDVIGPLEVAELPEGYIAIDAAIIIKALNEDGKVSWLTRYTKAPHAVEFLGALEAAVMLLKEDVRACYAPDPEDDDG